MGWGRMLARLRVLTNDRAEVTRGPLRHGAGLQHAAHRRQDTHRDPRAPRRRLLDLIIILELSRAHLLALMWRMPRGRHLRQRRWTKFQLNEDQAASFASWWRDFTAKVSHP